ncbi:DnaJ-domain-containing protein [Gloeophyllum trabeum ATCC 11539]|uniref:DnaJ-domain-containing protein n=1 Tax=Gloeophyllum trabeum (strain ATCC 11539 / FP-39264 / Madison 617) TaxID=670483 RepID=S7RNF0_GLOTA|nr:DnaJ-domain-containing protein [Gloeophyllum trabeum ATCC 11539]EPQ54299.1 DnaJ-domain-containing protein [Gloeophyllum trabeum ATCC 11539]
MLEFFGDWNAASAYFYLPIDEENDASSSTVSKQISWKEGQSGDVKGCAPSDSASDARARPTSRKTAAIDDVLARNDLYEVLGIPKSKAVDRLALRRAYLLRSKECHPDKFPNNPEATRAFQKVCIAYDVLSKPSSKRIYDSCRSPQDFFNARPPGYSEQTFRGVVIGVFNDFLDGDLEMVRTLLRSVNDINPSLRLGEETVNAVLSTLHNIRERALTCRTCILALHAELGHLLEVQHAFRQLSYFDLMGRSRLTVQLARITLSMPMAIERAIQEQALLSGADIKNEKALIPRPVGAVIRSVVLVLERLERILK